ISERPVHDLDDMERSFEAGQLAFGWYILRLTALADRLWHEADAGLYRSFYDRLRQADEHVNRADLEALDPTVGPALAAWPQV
ncbi:MAG: hypothetical protein K1X38_15825, partial [Microthrixaceae bacterium]|nr:hypothetical protein [Microthrixaceae bacterium]